MNLSPIVTIDEESPALQAIGNAVSASPRVVELAQGVGGGCVTGG